MYGEGWSIHITILLFTIQAVSQPWLDGESGFHNKQWTRSTNIISSYHKPDKSSKAQSSNEEIWALILTTTPNTYLSTSFPFNVKRKPIRFGPIHYRPIFKWIINQVAEAMPNNYLETFEINKKPLDFLITVLLKFHLETS